MALRKMLGDVQSAAVRALMAQIETQSHVTLTQWAITTVARELLPLLAETEQQDLFCDTITAVHAHLCHTANGTADKTALTQVKAQLKTARENAAAIKDPMQQAAARAVAAACAVVTTPTNALGFTFYFCAAKAYAALGTDKSAADYDTYADEMMQHLHASLCAVSVENETKPVRVNWNC